jgi:hypothetical protein
MEFGGLPRLTGGDSPLRHNGFRVQSGPTRTYDLNRSKALKVGALIARPKLPQSGGDEPSPRPRVGGMPLAVRSYGSSAPESASHQPKRATEGNDHRKLRLAAAGPAPSAHRVHHPGGLVSRAGTGSCRGSALREKPSGSAGARTAVYLAQRQRRGCRRRKVGRRSPDVRVPSTEVGGGTVRTCGRDRRSNMMRTDPSRNTAPISVRSTVRGCPPPRTWT